MVDTDGSGMLQILSDNLYEELITLLTQPVGDQRWKPPVLTPETEVVRRSADVDVKGKYLLIAPYITAVGE